MQSRVSHQESHSLGVSSIGGRFPLVVSLLVMLCGAALFVGCGKSSSTPDADAGLWPEAVAVRKAFAASDPSYRNPVAETLALVRAGGVNPAGYAEALPRLERLAANSTITREQKQALETLIQKIKSMGIKSAGPGEIR